MMTQPKKYWNLILWATYWSNKIVNPGINGVVGKESGIYAQLMSKFTIDKTQKLDLTIGGSTPMKITGGEIKPMLKVDISYKKEISKKLSFIATIKDALDSREFKVERYEKVFGNNNDFYLTSTDANFRRSKRQFKIAFEYTFGAYQKKKYIREEQRQGYDGQGGGGMDMTY